MPGPRADTNTAATLLSPNVRRSRGDRTIRVAEQLTVRNGMIASSVFVTDMVAFASFVGSERTDRA